jgi:hypothetical protein
VLAVMSGRVEAQPGESSAIAEQLFTEARELAKANRWAEACPRFEASLRSDPVLGTRLNLATCYEHIARLASAWSLYRESIVLAKKAGDAKRRAYAEKQAAALEPRLPRLVIAAPRTPPAGFVVTRDGTTIDAGALGVALYVDPGLHEIVASAPRCEAFQQTVMLVEGKTETLAIPDLQAVGLAKPPIEALDVTTPRGYAISPVRRYVVVGGGIGGMAVLGAGFLFGRNASSVYAEARALCGANLVCAPANYDRGQQLIRETRSSAALSTVLMAVGGVAIVTSAVVLLTASPARERAMARIVPVAHDRGAGLALIGRF